MQFLRAATALVLSSTLCFPAPIGWAQAPDAGGQPQVAAPAPAKNRPEYATGKSNSAPMNADERILHALDRFTFGPRPGDLEAVRKMGLERWFEAQLHPENFDESDLNARLAEYPAMRSSTQDLLYRMPSGERIRMAANGKIEIPSSGILHAVYENQLYRMQLRKAAQAEKQAANSAPSSTVAEPRAGSPSPSGEMQPGMMQPAAMNAMMPAASGANAPAAPVADAAQIARMMALTPADRVKQLAAMPPEAFENFIQSLRPPQRQGLAADMTPEQRETVEDLEHPEETIVRELMAERLARDIYSNAQLAEVMTDFWLNHFNIYLRKNEQMPYYLVSYERDTIRPHALGNFEELLEAVAHSPAMMIYLDNAESMGPDSEAAARAKFVEARQPDAKRKAPNGLNENYARELMELHTVGVNGGYTQADVIQVARVLTGWTVDRPQLGGEFVFNPNRHEPGTKLVMGAKIKERGEMEGRELLHMLAMKPATAQFISRKLAVRFVSDDPPQALVDRMAKAYLKSGGDIPSVLRALFHSPEFWTAGDYRAKVKTPLEYVVSAARASNAEVENYQPLVNALRQMGMPLYGCMPPVGYKWNESEWVSTGALVDRMNFALALASNRSPGIRVAWTTESQQSTSDAEPQEQPLLITPESEEMRLEQMLAPGGVSGTTRAAALKQIADLNFPASPAAARKTYRAPSGNAIEREDQLLAGLLMGGPEFQRR